MKSSVSKGAPLASPTAESRRTSKTSIKKPVSMSQKSNCSQTVHKSKPDNGSPHLSQVEIPKFSSPLSFPPDASPLASTRSSTPKEHLSPSPSVSLLLRSTFTVSPSSSTDLTLLPRVNQSTPLQKGSNSSLLPEQFQSSKLFPGPISSPKLLQSPPSNLESPQQSQDSLCDPECLLSVNQLQLPQSSKPNPQTKSLGPSLSQTTPVPFRAPVKTPSRSSLFYESPPDADSSYKSTPTYRDAPVLMSSTAISGDHELAPSHQDTDAYIPSPHPLNVTPDPHLAVKMTEELKLSVDSGDEMSSDSLGLTPHEEGSTDEEAQMHGCLRRGRSREEEQENSAISHLGDSFVPTDAEREKYLWTDEPEQLSELSMVMHNQSAGSGSEHFCDLDGFSPLGLDLNSGSEARGSSSSLSAFTEKHMVFSSDRSYTSHAPRITPRPFPASVSPSLFQSPSRPLSTGLSHPTLGSEVDLAVRPLCRAAQEILEICSMDQSGCEDPDLDSDTVALALHSLNQELRLMAKGTESARNKRKRTRLHRETGRVSSYYPEIHKHMHIIAHKYPYL
ncbi:hypothetical protein INR49_018702 [Caranx melampygus]|nr:hypothetical protein INR49_018702 [Caranx melampygus]